MREKKRLDGMLATDADLRRRLADISAYFELAKEGEKSSPTFSARSARSSPKSIASKPKPCSPEITTTVTRS
jgi:hypothetical protein